jgi:hypothetical protein
VLRVAAPGCAAGAARGPAIVEPVLLPGLAVPLLVCATATPKESAIAAASGTRRSEVDFMGSPG